MANTEYSARSNYFHVRDKDAFTEWAKKRELTIEVSSSDETMFAIFPIYGGWHEWNDEDENGEFTEIDMAEELSKHLIDNEVAILQQVYNQKLRFLGGISTAVISDGSRLDIDIDDIYKMVKDKFPNMAVTEAEY